jgi:hypothetical protein
LSINLNISPSNFPQFFEEHIHIFDTTYKTVSTIHQDDELTNNEQLLSKLTENNNEQTINKSSLLLSFPSLTTLCTEINNSFYYNNSELTNLSIIVDTSITESISIAMNLSHLSTSSLSTDLSVISSNYQPDPTFICGYTKSNYPIYTKSYFNHNNNNTNSANLSSNSLLTTQFSRQYYPQIAHYLLLISTLKLPNFIKRVSYSFNSLSLLSLLFTNDLLLYPQFNVESMIYSRQQLPQLIQLTLSNIIQVSISPLITSLSLSLLSTSINNTIVDNDDINSEYSNTKYYTLKYKRFINSAYTLQSSHFSPQNYYNIVLSSTTNTQLVSNQANQQAQAQQQQIVGIKSILLRALQSLVIIN